MDDAKRLTELYAERELVNAQITGLESGILPYLRSRRVVTPNDLAARFGFSKTNANNKLARLWRVGLLDRRRRDPKEGGKMYEYRLAKPGRWK